MSGVNPRAEINSLVAYDAPQPVADVVLVANENPDNLPGPVLEEIRRLAGELAFNRYPDPRALALREALAEANGTGVDNVIVGNGGDEILVMTCLAFGGTGRAVLTFPPTFSMYAIIGNSTGTDVRAVPRKTDFSIDVDAACEAATGADIVFLSNPNNPTGNLEHRGVVGDLARSARGLLVLDEAYCEFAGTSHADILGEFDNVLVLRTFSKAFSMAGLRVGYALGASELVGHLQKVRLPYNSNVFSQAVALAALRHRPLFEERVGLIVTERRRVTETLAEVEGVTVYPSAANYLLLRVERAAEVWSRLLDAGVLVRAFPGDEYLKEHLRVTIGSKTENERFLEALRAALS